MAVLAAQPWKMVLASVLLGGAGCAPPPAARCAAAEPPERAAAGSSSPTDRFLRAGAAAAPIRASVRPKSQAQVLRAPGGKAEVTVLARGRNAFVAELSIAPNARIPEHQDATEEYIHVLEGEGTITIDGTSHRIGPGDTVFMPARATVRFENGPAPMRVLQVFAGPEPAAKYDAWQPAAQP